ncbi:MAG: transglycosylase domain-containing protein [Pseudomonadota bacterium]
MRKIIKVIALAAFVVFCSAAIYGGIGYLDAVHDSKSLKARADLLISDDKGGSSLGPQKYAQILLVQDPQFESHTGLDISTPGAGITTITQSVAKRLGFEQFKPGIGKIRQSGYALGLERELNKEQIMALWLDTLEMGRGPRGWMAGFHNASQQVFAANPSELSHEQFLTLVAVLIAPAQYRIGSNDAGLQERVRRITRLISNECRPLSNGDVWLEGCHASN